MQALKCILKIYFRVSDKKYSYGMFRLLRNIFAHLMFIGPCIIVIAEERKTNLMSLAVLLHFLCAQHVSDINIAIIRSLRLC